jgi:hypothetical protein
MDKLQLSVPVLVAAVGILIVLLLVSKNALLTLLQVILG